MIETKELKGGGLEGGEELILVDLLEIGPGRGLHRGGGFHRVAVRPGELVLVGHLNVNKPVRFVIRVVRRFDRRLDISEEEEGEEVERRWLPFLFSFLLLLKGTLKKRFTHLIRVRKASSTFTPESQLDSMYCTLYSSARFWARQGWTSRVFPRSPLFPTMIFCRKVYFSSPLIHR